MLHFVVQFFRPKIILPPQKMQLDLSQVEKPCHSNNYMLPLDSPKSPRPNKTVDAVSLILERIIQSNERYLQQLQKPPVYKFPRLVQTFTYEDGQQLSFERIRKIIYNFSYRTRLRNETLVGAIVYLDRLVQKSGIVISKQNYLFVIATTLIACQKMYDDFHYSLKDYASVFNVPLPQLVKCEHAFLKLIRYDLIVDPDDYNQYRQYIVVKFDATLRDAAPFSPNQSILNKFELRQLASIKDVGEFVMSTLKGQNQAIEENDHEIEKNELKGARNMEQLNIQLPGAKFD